MEDLSQRTETTQVFANPDGSWTSEEAASPVRTQDENGDWSDIDLTLEKVDGGYAPANALGDLVISDGGDQTFAEMTVDGRDLDWKWPGDLPEPTIEGNTATYADVVDGGDGDLVVTATASGFRHDIVLHEAPADPVAFDIPVVTTGPKVSEQANGSLTVETKAGNDLVSAAPPVMYDAPDPQTGESEHVAPVDTTVTQTATGGVVKLDPDEAFLNDPSTTYPVTIDPNYSSTDPDDTWAYNTSPTTGHPGDVTLYAGTPDAGATKYRSFITFVGLGNLPGGVVSSATLTLRNFYSTQCTGPAAGVQVRRIIQSWTPAGLNWNNQPSTSTTNAVSTGTAYGATGCPTATDVSWNVTAMVQDMATYGYYGFRVGAVDETKTASYRRYRAAGYQPIGGAAIPRLSVTYNHYPNTPNDVELSPYQNGLASSTTPVLSADVSDQDSADQVRARFNLYSGSNLIWYADGNPVTGSGTSSITVPAGKMTNGGTYTLRAYGYDGAYFSGLNATTGGYLEVPITIDTSPPSVAVTSSAYSNGQWLETPPATNTFTLNSDADVASFTVDEDGDISDVEPGAPGRATVDWNPDSGAHVLKVTPIDNAGNAGTQETFSFGTSKPDFTAPDDAQTSAGTFPVTASGPPVATGATLTWRMAGKTTWNPVTSITNTSGTDWDGSVTTSNGGAGTTTGSLQWKATDETDPATSTKMSSPSLLELRACFTVLVGGPLCSDARKVQLTSAFGGNFPVATLGPAQVALYTGEAAIDGVDAADANAGLGRSFSSFNPATQTAGVFGPGWSDPSVLAAPNADAKAQVVDNRSKDGSFVIVDTDSGSQAFVPKSGTTTSDYVPLQPTGDATALTFTLGSNGSADKLQLSRPVGAGSVITTWTLKASDSGATPAWTVDTVDAPGTGTDVTVQSADNSQRPIWIRESEPSAAATCTATTQTVGCRGLAISYTGSGAAARVSSVSRVIGADDPDPVVTKTLETYTYDVTGKLTSACSAAPAEGEPALCTSYAYTTVNGRALLGQVIPAGLKPWQFDYDTKGRLTTVTREKPTGGDAIWSVDYSLGVGSAGLPDLSESTAAQWGQQTIPTKVFAVYEPHTGTADVTNANLYYTSTDGALTNTASYGPSDWLVKTNWYDTAGHLVRQLDSTGWARVQAAASTDRLRVADEASNYTVYNTWGPTDIVGTRIVDQYGPAHSATLKNGTSGLFRSHSHTMYDDDPDVSPSLIADRPGQSGIGLVVQTTASVSNAVRTNDFDPEVTKYGYGPVVAGDGNGWILAAPTAISSQVDANSWSTAITRYDSSGGVLETRQPGGATDSSGAGNDAHAMTTTYYTAGGSGDCGGKPAWDGLICKIGPAGQPTGPTTPTMYNADYNDDMQPTKVQEISGGVVTRTTTTTYDNLGRTTETIKATSGAGVSNETIATTFDYDDVTGLPVRTTSGGKTIANGYDSWGRHVSYTDALGTTSATSYNAAGDVATFDDGSATTTYNYDAHGMLTNVDAGGGIGTFSYTYAVDGNVDKVTYPNGITAVPRFDELGAQTALTYMQAATTLLAFSATKTAAGKTVQASSPASTQANTYDGLGRLIKVEDTRVAGCTTRVYEFDAASNRSSLSSYSPASNGACQTTNAASSGSYNFDAAGRIRNAGYAYDTLGRTTTTPQVDAGPGSGGDLTAMYHADDMVATLSQDVLNVSGGSDALVRSYGLDPAERIDSVTSTVNGTETQRLRYRFAAGGDSPSSIDTSLDGGSNWVSVRYVSLPGLGLVASSTSGTTTLHLANMHGDLVATIDGGPGSTTIASYSETDEYGNSTGGTPVTRYGWLGSLQRSNDTVGGLMMMGARLFNPKTGLFLSADSVYGGNRTVYGYPEDPVGSNDSTGQYGCEGRGADCERMKTACFRYAGAGTCYTLLKSLKWLADVYVPYTHTAYRATWNQMEAGRHFAFIVYTAYLIGTAAAAAVAAAHEVTSGLDTDRDKANNAYSLQWFRGHPAKARELVYMKFPRDALVSLYWHGVSLYNMGYMWGLCVRKGKDTLVHGTC